MKVKHIGWFVASGCFLIAAVNIVGRYTMIPDSLKGFIMGLGIALEILPLIIYRRQRRVCGKE